MNKLLQLYLLIMSVEKRGLSSQKRTYDPRAHTGFYQQRLRMKAPSTKRQAACTSICCHGEERDSAVWTLVSPTPCAHVVD
jgi:hypothetical protein